MSSTHHTKTDSEVTSLAPSSPNRAVYYVQSPSRDSHDGEKTTNSFHSTPILSPMGSPGRASRDSSSTRFSGSLKPGSQKSSNCRNLQSISFDEFVVQAGMDHSGVATEMVSMNSTVKLVFRNKGTFFGMHVTSTPLDLSFSELTVATGTINKFYQSRKSQRTLTVTLRGKGIPLYGGGADLTSKEGKPTAPVPLTLGFTVRARAYVLGRLVKPKFYREIHCSVIMDPKKMNKALQFKNNCTYT
nr:Late embryogenesis abundant protein, LEA-14 [Ipomoea batatas]